MVKRVPFLPRDKAVTGSKELVKKDRDSGSSAKHERAKSVTELEYLSGFGNHFETEAEKGALPKGQNSPQKPPMGLYAEQLSGSSFTAARAENLRSWLYRIRPSVLHSRFTRIDNRFWRSKPFDEVISPPDQFRWDPLPIPAEPTDFIEGIITFAGNGERSSWRGSAVHVFAANKSMTQRFFLQCGRGAFDRCSIRHANFSH